MRKLMQKNVSFIGLIKMIHENGTLIVPLLVMPSRAHKKSPSARIMRKGNV
jgi:hypothetical protein